MGISNDSKKLIRDQLRGAKIKKKMLISQIQILNAQKDALSAEKDLLTTKIANLEADLNK